MGRLVLLVIGMALLLCGGCVYTSAGGHPAVEEFPPPVWDESEKAFRQEFPAYSYYSRSGVYPPGTKLTPGGAHWGQVGDMIEGLAHLPTFWLEWALSAERKTDYDVVFLDRNSTRGNVSLRAFPVYAFDDRLLRQEPFRPYWTNTVFGIDFAEGERIIAGKNASRKTIGEHRAWLLYLDKLENACPVLWWTDGSGVENLIVFQCLRSPPTKERDFGECLGYRLLHFRNFGFVRAFDFAPAEKTYYPSAFVFSTLDGRFVNIGYVGRYPSDSCDWMFRQIDLETGDDRKVGSYGALEKGDVNGGLEIRTEARPSR